MALTAASLRQSPAPRRPTGGGGDFALNIQVPPVAESLVLVRQAITGVGSALGLEGAELDDVRLAVSEVCAAAVRTGADNGHRVTVAAKVAGGALRVTVHGGGLTGTAALGGVLPLVAALARSLEVSSPRGVVEVAMVFSLPPRLRAV